MSPREYIKFLRPFAKGRVMTWALHIDALFYGVAGHLVRIKL